MAVVLLPNGRQQFIDISGQPLVAGTVGMYVPGTLRPKDTWQDSGQSVLNSNPITLDSRGQATIWGSGVYRQILRDANGDLIWDKITSSGIGPSGGTLLFFLSNYATIELANAAAYAVHGILLIDIDYTLTANTTMTAACESAGGIITRGSYTLAFNGGFVADPMVTCFDVAGTGRITIRGNSGWSACWFGAKCDGTSDGSGTGTDDYVAYQAMFDNCQNGDPVIIPGKSNIGSQLLLGAGINFVTTGCFFPKNVSYGGVADRWALTRGCVLNFTDPASCGIRYVNHTFPAAFHAAPPIRITGPGMALIGPGSGTGIGLQLGVVADGLNYPIDGITLDNIAVGNFPTGVVGAHSLYVTFNQCWLYGNDIAVDTVNNLASIWCFNECNVDTNNTWGFRDTWAAAGFIIRGGSWQGNGNASALSGAISCSGTSFVLIDGPWLEFDSTVGLSVDMYFSSVSSLHATNIADLKRPTQITGAQTASLGDVVFDNCGSNSIGGASIVIDASVVNPIAISNCLALTVTDNSGVAYFTGPPLLPVKGGITAHAGGGQSTATQLVAYKNRVTTVATAADSVRLPDAYPALEIEVINDGANDLQLFAMGSATINGAASGTGVSVPAGKIWAGSALTSLTWYGGTLG